MSLIDEQKYISSVSQLKKLLDDKCRNEGCFKKICQVNTSVIGMLIHVFSVFCCVLLITYFQFFYNFCKVF